MMLALQFAGVQADQNINIAASAQLTKATIGDRINLQIHIAHPTSFQLQPSTISALGDFLVTETKKSSELKQNDLVDENLNLTLVTFSTGTITIPSLALTLTPAQGPPVTVKTPDIPITIESVLTRHKDRGDIQDIKGQIGFFNPLPWILGILILALAALVAWLISKRSKSSLAKKSLEPPRPPEEIAREALAKLQEKRLVEESRFKEFYVEFSDILRNYIEKRFAVPCLDRTTSEIILEIKPLRISLNDFQSIRELLQDCDLVKFAKFQPPLEEVNQHLEKALSFIDNTSPQRPKPMGSHVSAR